MSGCCTPSRAGAGALPWSAADPSGAQAGDTAGMILLPGGSFLMGTEDPLGYEADGERPVRLRRVAPFWIDPFAVTNARFAEFVAQTGHRTQAERDGWSFVFRGMLPLDSPSQPEVVGAPWWRATRGASWRHPEGPGSSVAERMDHPVVHVSWHDAMAWCAWAGLRLPSEAEWEYAARGGLVQARYPWGDLLLRDGKHQCNIWQGTFPEHNSGEDGYLGTAPVDAFAPNGFGLYNVVGNVWEWCADPISGPRAGREERRATRGGSYLCHASYCFRYRVAARNANTPDSSTGHQGFRAARDA